MNSKQQLWQQIQTQWPELAKFLIELKQAGMKAEKVEVTWENTKTL